jgi:hypothetical protein
MTPPLTGRSPGRSRRSMRYDNVRPPCHSRSRTGCWWRWLVDHQRRAPPATPNRREMVAGDRRTARSKGLTPAAVGTDSHQPRPCSMARNRIRGRPPHRTVQGQSAEAAVRKRLSRKFRFRASKTKRSRLNREPAFQFESSIRQHAALLRWLGRGHSLLGPGHAVAGAASRGPQRGRSGGASAR